MQSPGSPRWCWRYLRLSCCLAVLSALLQHTLALPDVIKIGKKKEDEFKNSYIAKWAYQTHSATPTLDYLSASWSLFSPASTLIYWFFVCIKFITLKLCMYVVGRTAAVYAQCKSGVSCTEASERLISSSVRMSGNYELTCIHMNSIKWN